MTPASRTGAPSTAAPARLGFLGPAGTFCEAALHAMPRSKGATLIPYRSVPAAIDAVRVAEADGVLVPIENSIEGSVSTTLDALAIGAPLMIADEVTIPVTFALVGQPGTKLADVRRVSTHPHAEAQCRGWLAANLPEAVTLPAMSTAGAAAALVDGSATDEAAICPQWAASTYGLDVLASDIGDNHEASTRFVLITRLGPVPAPTGADKTTLVLYMREDHSGALLEILTEFAVRGINLTRIESRPTRRVLGDYCFSIDCEGHVADARVGEALTGLYRVCKTVRFLGSYPRHDGRTPHVRPGTSDTEFAEAADWLQHVRSGALLP